MGLSKIISIEYENKTYSLDTNKILEIIRVLIEKSTSDSLIKDIDINECSNDEDFILLLKRFNLYDDMFFEKYSEVFV